MNTDQFFTAIDSLYASWRDYSIRVEKAEQGQAQSFSLKDLKETNHFLYTRLVERLDSAKDLAIDMPQDRAWSWLIQGY